MIDFGKNEEKKLSNLYLPYIYHESQIIWSWKKKCAQILPWIIELLQLQILNISIQTRNGFRNNICWFIYLKCSSVGYSYISTMSHSKIWTLKHPTCSVCLHYRVDMVEHAKSKLRWFSTKNIQVLFLLFKVSCKQLSLHFFSSRTKHLSERFFGRALRHSISTV